jgi:regulator of protease activity HflC (stomatin/prohibitin superfamily)
MMFFSFRRITEVMRRALGPSVLVLAVAVVFAVLTRAVVVVEEPDVPLVTPGWMVLTGLLMLAVVAAALVPIWFAGRFVRDLYALPGTQSGMGFVSRYRFGKLGFRPWMRIGSGRIDAQTDKVLSQIGGPGSMIVGRDSAVMLESGGKFSRMMGPGLVNLEPFERIYEFVDLRPKRRQHLVSAMTLEGIPIQWHVEVRYRIADGADSPELRGAQYSFSPKEAFHATTSRWVREAGWHGGQDMDWEGLLVAYHTDDILRSMLALRPLDELIGWKQKDKKTSREWLQEELLQKLQAVAPDLGAQILQVTLGNLEVEDDVTRQWIKFWEAEWQNRSAEELAEGEAHYISEYETLKAQAQMEMVAAVTDELRKQLLREKKKLPADSVPQYVLMRLFSVLDRAEFASASRVFFPAETLDALENVRRTVAMQTGPEVDEILMDVEQQDIEINGQTVVTATVLDAAGNPMPNGTLVEFTTNLGTIAPGLSPTSNGQATTVFTAGSDAGDASVIALSGGVFRRATITIA